MDLFRLLAVSIPLVGLEEGINPFGKLRSLGKVRPLLLTTAICPYVT